MATHLLRIEATNFAWAIDDTADLSTRRGGSLAVLHAAKVVTQAFHARLTPVSIGASIGLFEVIDGDPAGLRKDVEALLRTGTAAPADLAEVLPHLTFSVALVEGSGDVIGDEQRLLALNRWSQLQSPTLAKPDLSGHEPCGEDHLRPSSVDPSFVKDSVRLSTSVYRRREYGKEQKKGEFYLSLLDSTRHADLISLVESRFVPDLEKLAKYEGDDKRLTGKIAVLYADGNGFGNLREKGARAADGPDAAMTFLREFDTTLRGLQRDFLASLLQLATATDAEAWQLNGKIRLETLLWGGDEIMLVVPARFGWKILDLFLAQPWAINGQDLTFKVGLVFCHHNAPIRRISRLAHDLGDSAKGDGSQSRVAYEVLESFDHLGTRPDKMRERRAGDLTDALLLDKKMIDQLTTAEGLRSAELPRSRLVELVREARSGTQGEAERTAKAARIAEIERLLCRRLSVPAEQTVVETFKSAFTPPEAAWLHLAELWDYLGK